MTVLKRAVGLILLLLLLCGCTVSRNTPTAFPGLTVHFLDVGQADCALLECGGEFMLIDGGNVEDGQAVVSYLQDQGVEELTCVVSTHAHEDHVGGLPAVLAIYPTQRIYSPTTTYASACFDDFLYYADQQRIAIQIPAPGDTFLLGQSKITVLGPVTTYADTNDTSLVLRVDYGQTSFLFTGDMETTAENDLLDYGADVKADVLKVGHHGSSTSTGYRFLYEVEPEYAVISCGADNVYGHPHEEVVSRLRDAGVSTFRTDILGTVVAVSDGCDITFTWDHSQNAPDDVTAAVPIYIGNANSRKYHDPGCANLPAVQNRVYFDTIQQAQKAGYTPCGNCLP